MMKPVTRRQLHQHSAQIYLPCSISVLYKHNEMKLKFQNLFLFPNYHLRKNTCLPLCGRLMAKATVLLSNIWLHGLVSVCSLKLLCVLAAAMFKHTCKKCPQTICSRLICSVPAPLQQRCSFSHCCVLNAQTAVVQVLEAP